MALVAQYLFKDNGNDETGNYNGTPANLTYENAPTDKTFGSKVAVFNGSSSKIDLPNITPVSGTAARTIEFWHYISSWTSSKVPFSFGTGTNTSYYALSLASNYAISFEGTSYATVPTIGTGWHHMAVTISAGGNSSAIKVYYDGVLQSSTPNGSATINTSNDNGAIGYLRSINNYYFSGKLANFRIYNEELSAATILSHYNSESRSPSGFFNFF